MESETKGCVNKYKHVKLYTDYNLDTYESLLGRDSRESVGSRGRIKKSNLLPLPSALKKHVDGGGVATTVGASPYLQYKPCVSFDTVPVSSPSKDSLIEKEYPSYDFPGVQIPPELYTMDEWYDNESGYATNDNSGYFIHNDYLTGGSDGGTDGKRKPSARSRSPPRIKTPTSLRQMQSMFKVALNGKIVREDYPSRPTVANDAMIINRAYDKWSQLWNKRRLTIDERLLDRKKFFRYPEILFPDLRKDKDNDKSEEKDKEYQNMTKREKRRWLIMNEVIGYPTCPKTILCHISGRKHTWVGLDYTIMKLAQDTDHVVIVANLAKLKRMTPLIHRHHHHQHKRLSSHPTYARSMSNMYTGENTNQEHNVYEGNKDDVDTEGLGLTKVKSVDAEILKDNRVYSTEEEDSCEEGDEDPEWASGYDRRSIEDKLNDLLLYISVLLSKNPKSIKVTVEIVIGKSPSVLNEMVNVYMPDLFVMSKKKLTSEIRWHSVHLTDKFLKHSPVPVCVVFVKPMFQFEVDLEKQFPKDSALVKSKSEATSIQLHNAQGNHISLTQIDEWINKSIATGCKIARPQQPKVMKSMIEIALASDTKRSSSSHRSSSNPAGKTNARSHSKRRNPTVSPLRTQLHRPELVHHGASVPATLDVPLTKTRTISTARPVKNWNAEKNTLRRIKSNSPNNESSPSGGGNSNGSGGFLSSLFKRRW